VKKSTVATKTKFHKLNVRIQHYSYTLHYSINDIIHALWHYSLYHTNNTHTTQKHTKTLSQWTYTNSTTLERHKHQHTENLTSNKTIVPDNDAKFDRGRTPPN